MTHLGVGPQRQREVASGDVKAWLQSKNRKQLWLAAELQTSGATVSNFMHGKLGERATRKLSAKIRELMERDSAAHAGGTGQAFEHGTPPSRPSLAAASGGVEKTTAADTCAEDDEGVCVVATGHAADSIMVLAPHPRHLCLVCPFSPDTAERTCANCYCWVCDTPAVRCGQWPEHCQASPEGPAGAHWRDMRRAAANRARCGSQQTLLGWVRRSVDRQAATRMVAIDGSSARPVTRDATSARPVDLTADESAPPAGDEAPAAIVSSTTDSHSARASPGPLLGQRPTGADASGTQPDGGVDEDDVKPLRVTFFQVKLRIDQSFPDDGELLAS